MVTIRCLPDSPHPQYAYRIVGQLLLADISIPPLTPFATPLPHPLTLPPCHPVALSPTRLVTYNGPAWIGNTWRQLTCRRSQDGYSLAIEGIAQFTIAATGAEIRRHAVDPAATDTQLAEALLGPALTLALALRGIFCLHASAVVVEDHLLLFLGPSGSGKSTLARHLDQANGWPLVADDILPVHFDDGLLLALPHFPQLKLDGPSQPALGLPQAMPIRAIYLLDEPSPDEVQIQPLSLQASTVRLIRHTVSARLFDQKLLAAHMAFCAAAARRQPIHQLLYPRQRHLLPRVQSLIEGEIAIAR